MDYEALRAGLEMAIPFNTHVGLEVREVAPGRGVVALPDSDATRNHVGSQHAGALFSAGEAASGAAFASVFAERMGDVVALAEKAEIHYGAIARGEILATGTVEGDGTELLEALERDGRVRFGIPVVLTNRAKDAVATMRVEWHVKRK